MAWSAPKTWTAETLTSADLNTYVRDNQNALKAPPRDAVVLNEVSNYSTTSTTFADVDATSLSLTITDFAGGDLLVGFCGSVSSNGSVYFDVTVDGARIGGDDGITAKEAGVSAAPGDNLSFVRVVTGLSAGTLTVRLQWKVGTNSATLWSGAGTANGDLHAQFWAREI